MTEARESFCARLKAARERKGVSLDQIAASTKITVSILKGLESNNLSRWPKGLFRRSNLRDYLTAVGLPVEPTVAEFVRLFPDEDAPPVEAVIADQAAPPRPLPQAAAEIQVSEPSGLTRKRVLAATLDVATVLALAGLIAWLTPATAWAASAVVALAYYAVGTACLGGSAGSWWLDDRARHGRPSPAIVSDLDGRLRRWVARGASWRPGLPRVARHADAGRPDGESRRSSRRKRNRPRNSPLVRIKLVR